MIFGSAKQGWLKHAISWGVGTWDFYWGSSSIDGDSFLRSPRDDFPSRNVFILMGQCSIHQNYEVHLLEVRKDLLERFIPAGNVSTSMSCARRKTSCEQLKLNPGVGW
jgi:hypothetical protein